MGRKASVVSVRDQFIRTLDSNLNLFEAMLPYSEYTYHNNKSVIKPTQATRVLGLCFMSTVGAWEEFLGSSFMRYMAGASTGTYTPSLSIGPCKNLRHAIDVVAGEANFDLAKKYLTWTRYEEVTLKAKVFFERGEPYTKISPMLQERICDAVILRNRVAHSSEKCKKDFSKVAKKLLGMKGNLKQGTSVGKLLQATKVNHFGQALNGSKTYYHAFDAAFRQMAFTIVPV